MVFMPGRRLRSASSQQVAEVTKYAGCAVASAVEGCGEAHLIRVAAAHNRSAAALAYNSLLRNDTRAARHVQQRTTRYYSNQSGPHVSIQLLTINLHLTLNQFHASHDCRENTFISLMA
ncbi:unnamed protein product [Ascophyllum nodosum]